MNFNSTQAVFPDYENEVTVVKVSDISGNEISDITSCFDRIEDRTARALPALCDLALKHVPVKSLIYYPDNKASFKTIIVHNIFIFC